MVYSTYNDAQLGEALVQALERREERFLEGHASRSQGFEGLAVEVQNYPISTSSQASRLKEEM